MIGSTCELEHQMDLAQSYTVSISFMEKLGLLHNPVAGGGE